VEINKEMGKIHQNHQPPFECTLDQGFMLVFYFRSTSFSLKGSLATGNLKYDILEPKFNATTRTMCFYKYCIDYGVEGKNTVSIATQKNVIVIIIQRFTYSAPHGREPVS
jgi:hypothetical protein